MICALVQGDEELELAVGALLAATYSRLGSGRRELTVYPARGRNSGRKTEGLLAGTETSG
jgi:hypothetical protein